MFNVQFHKDPKKVGSEAFKKPSMTEPDNAMSIPEIISRYVRGHGLQVPVIPVDLEQRVSTEDGYDWQDDADMLDPFGAPPADKQEDPKAAAAPASSEAGQE